MTALVVLFRHGIAQPRGTMPEETRKLTKEGHQRMEEIARGLRRLVPKADEVVSSPLLRCTQTAEWIAGAYGLTFSVASELRPEAGPKEVRDLLDRLEGSRLILVGHEPGLSQAMRNLTGEKSMLELKKGGCYGLRVVAGQARLEWMLTPRLLRRA